MAKNKFISFVKNVSYTAVANILSMLISAIALLVIPKIVSVETYGYFQLYTFYIFYVGVSYLGWCEGIYLREGGKHYKDLDKPMYSAQFWLLGLFEVILYGIILIFAVFYSNDVNKHYVYMFVCTAAVGMCLRWFITFILQATARIKEFAIITISERIVYIMLVVILLALGYRNFILLIGADVAGKYISLLIGMWYCRDMVFSKPSFSKSIFGEIKENMSAGIKLMFAVLSSMLIIGVIRFGVQSKWDIATFGKVSLTLTISNMVMTAINAIAVVLYPMLRRTSREQLPKLYGIMRVLLMGIIFGGLMFYYPAQRILSAWLPQYADSIRYAAILLPVCVYESKTAMLINTYFKALRLENMMMICNIAALAVSVVCAVLSIVVFESVTLAIISILIALMFRGIFSELVLSHHIDVSVKKDIVIEFIMSIAFIICNWYLGFTGMGIYALCYVGYILLKKNDLKQTFNYIINLR